MVKQTMPVFCVNEMKFKPQATVQKSEVKFFNWVAQFTILSVSNIWTLLNLPHLVHLLFYYIQKNADLRLLEMYET